MSKIDWLVIRRLGSRIAMVVVLFYGLITLVESLDAWRFNYLSNIGGVQLALTAIVANAARWTIKTLSVTVLLGAIIGILDLQTRRELTVIKAAGISIWRIVAGPTIAVAICSLFVSFVAENIVTQVNRSVFPSPLFNNGGLNSGELWLEQGKDDERYVLMAKQVSPETGVLADVVVFFRDTAKGSRITATDATLESGLWRFSNATLWGAESARRTLTAFTLPTTTTLADIKLKYKSTEDFTLLELGAAMAGNLSDPILRAAVTTRYAKLVTLPLLLVGSLLIAFAFTAGYRRTNTYGTTVLAGVVLGFVVFVITEMADRAGASGVLDPAFAAWGPAFIAIVIGVTVLLRKEDGRA